MFTKATKKRAKARIAISGPSGSGKTFTALMLAEVLAEGGEVAVIDSEHGSASLYADIYSFNTCEPDDFSPAVYIKAIKAAEASGAAVIVIDSLSHAWSGKGGALELVDMAAARSKSGNSFQAWRDVTPLHNSLIESILTSKCHVIATMRSKTEYVMEQDSKGRTVPRKVGLAPVQRADTDFEFTIALEMDHENRAVVTKTRCPILAGGVFSPPNRDLGQTILAWLQDGAEAPAAKPAEKPKPESGEFGINPKKPAGEQIANVKVPGLLLALLTTWEATTPISSRRDFWQKVYSASIEKYNREDWSDPDLVDKLNEIQMELAAQGKPQPAPAI